MRWMRSRKIKLLFLTCVAIMVSLLFAEILLRFLEFGQPLFLQPDPLLGSSLIPNLSGWFRSEGKAYIQINGAGYRDQERSVQKKAGVFRIAALGDSYLEALQVPMEQTITALLEKQLQPAEVLNFGCSGYGTAQEYLSLQHRIWAYSPDVVLVFFTVGNDVFDNCKELSGQPRPYFTLQDQKLVLDNSFLDSDFYHKHTSFLFQTFRILQKRSAIVQMAYRIQSQRTTARLLQQQQTLAQQYGSAGIELVDFTYQPPQPEGPALEKAWQITQALIHAIADETKQHNANLGLVLIPHCWQVHPNLEAREHVLKQLKVQDFSYPGIRLAQICSLKKIPILDLGPQFAQFSLEKKVFLHGFNGSGYGHWNSQGHQLASELVADWVRKLWVGQK